MDHLVRMVGMPSELAARVRAATGQPDYLNVGREGDSFVVHALTGDRVVIMGLALGADGSVDEFTETFTGAEVRGVTAQGDHGVVDVEDVDGNRRQHTVPWALARRLPG